MCRKEGFRYLLFCRNRQPIRGDEINGKNNQRIWDMYWICIGYRIRQERIKQNITQQELAQRLGISYSYYNNIEKGNRSCPIEVLIGICREFGISADRILRDFIPVDTEKNIKQ